MAEPGQNGSNRLLLGLTGFLIILAFSDIFGSKSTEVSAHKEVPPPPNFAKLMVGPSIKFLYCYSWGYRKVFEQYSGILQQKYPTLTIEGDNYPPPNWRLQLAQTLGYLKLALIVCILATFNPFPMMGMDTPSPFMRALENKMYACMMLFFICNAVESQLVSTGAFEISVDNMPVWSKLESGRIPQPPELFQIIDNHLQMNSGQGMRGIPEDGAASFHSKL